MESLYRSYTPEERTMLMEKLKYYYGRFLDTVAEGRKMKREDVDALGRGHVWTGSQAKENGLADILGNFDDAVKIAAAKAGVAADYELKYYPQPRPFLDRIMNSWEENTKMQAMQKELGVHYPWYQQWTKLKNYPGVQARMGVEFVVR